MYDRRFLRVQIIERIEQLIGPSQHFRRRESAPALREQFRHVVARNKLHHEELPVALREMIAHAGHRRVPETGEQPRFTFKSFAQELLGEETLFERDGVAEALIYGQINSAHATFANR